MLLLFQASYILYFNQLEILIAIVLTYQYISQTFYQRIVNHFL